LRLITHRPKAILLDAHVDGFGGGGKTFNWSLLPPSVNAHLVLSGGLTPANVTEGILQVRPRGLSLAVDVSSGVEAVGPDGNPLKGIKDPKRSTSLSPPYARLTDNLPEITPCTSINNPIRRGISEFMAGASSVKH
jgi:phosphoribosylanthranilate isomerase